MEREIKGIFIPNELAAETTLSWNAKAVYSIYHYFTFYGDGSCHITNEDIAARVGLKLTTMRDAKRQLKNAGWISTNGGIKVVALHRVTKSDTITEGDEIRHHNDNTDRVTKSDTITGSVEGDEIRQAKVTKSDRQGDEIRHHNKENKEENKIITIPTITKRDSHYTDTVGSSNGSVGIEMPEWLQDVPPTEPFEIYEEPTDTVTDKIGSNKGSLEVEKNDIFQGDESETDPDTNNNSKMADLGHYQAEGGATTHRQPETLPNGLKTTPTGATGNVNNLSLQDRKALQSELTRKWDNFILQVPNMRRDTSDTYFNRFLDKVKLYYTGDFIQRITSNWTDQYQGAANESWNDTKAKAIVKHGVSSAWPDTSIAHAVKERFGRVNREWLTVAIQDAKDAIYNVPLKVNSDPNGLPF